MKYFNKILIALIVILKIAFIQAQTKIIAIMPENGAKNVNVGILRWNGTMGMKYDLYFGTSNNPPLYKKDLNNTEEKPVILELNKTYYWKIIEKKDGKILQTTDVFSFSTLPIALNPALKYNSFVDTRDYKIYWTLIINGQEWMAHNLDYEITNQSWYYDNLENNKLYGKLYCGKLLQNSMNTICPEGWHIPSQQEWTSMLITLGGIKTVGVALKEASTKYWRNSNYQRTNTSGFTILPAGSRDSKPSFSNLGKYTFFWTSTSNPQKPGTFYTIDFGFMRDNAIIGVGDVNWSYSIRCVKEIKK